MRQNRSGTLALWLALGFVGGCEAPPAEKLAAASLQSSQQPAVDAGDTNALEAPPLTCEEYSAIIEDVLRPAFDRAAMGCQVDDDCLLSATFSACNHAGSWFGGVPVTRARLDELNAVIEGLPFVPCESSLEAQCVLAPPADFFHSGSLCRQGRCETCFGTQCGPEPEPEPEGDPASTCGVDWAEYSGSCMEAPRYHFHGAGCRQVSGCTCTGPDCGNAAETPEACNKRREACKLRANCFRSSDCGADSYCAHTPTHACGSATPEFLAVSICLPRPTTCGAEAYPVCGCDGTTYPNRCEAAKAGTGVRNAGPCAEQP